MSLFTPFLNGDLQPEKRSGHVSFYYNGQFFVLGGYGDWNDQGNEFLSAKHLWCYNIEASHWTRHTTTGTHPNNATGCCACVIRHQMYLFGGYIQQQGQTNELFSLDLRTFTWYDLSQQTKGLEPSPRDKFGCWKCKEKIIYFGGFGFPPDNLGKVIGEFCFEEFPRGLSRGFGWNNHLFVLDCSEKLKWSQPVCSGDIPCPRAAFACCQIGTTGYLFGGRFKDDRRNDLYSINLKTFEWNECKTIGIRPTGRSWHVMEKVSDHHLFIFGGFDTYGIELKDTWLFNVKMSMWTELKNASSHLGFFATRLWHTASHTHCSGEIVIFGGCGTSILSTEKALHTNNIAFFRFSPLPLRRLCLDFIMSNVNRYHSQFEYLPRSLRRNISVRSHAIGLSAYSGHGKLINNCQVM